MRIEWHLIQENHAVRHYFLPCLTFPIEVSRRFNVLRGRVGGPKPKLRYHGGHFGLKGLLSLSKAISNGRVVLGVLDNVNAM